MSAFVKKQGVPITIDGKNIIYIKPKLSYGDKQRLISATNHLAGTSQEDLKAEVDVGAYNLALLKMSITHWQGPDFEGLPCIAQNIEQLDPDYPLLEKVLEEINQRNTRSKDAPSPNSSSTDGSLPSKAIGESASETTTSISHSPNGTAGSLTESMPYPTTS